MIPIQPLIEAALPGDVITLPDGEYDDALPVIIRKDVKLQGSRAAIIHSEFYLGNGASVGFDGLTFQMNKAGAPQLTGIGSPYPQNGMITLVGAEMWMDDCTMVSLPGFNKKAIQAVDSFLNVRSRTKLSNIDWRNNPSTPIELDYNCYANFFDTSGQNLTFGIIYQTPNDLTAGINVGASKCVLSGAWLYSFGAGKCAARIFRDGYIHVGAGYPSGLATSTMGQFIDVQDVSRKYVTPGCIG